VSGGGDVERKPIRVRRMASEWPLEARKAGGKEIEVERHRQA
jgi:hypothetical protein